MLKLKELREDVGITQEELAKKIDTSQTNIGRWEKGLNEPTYSAIIKLADFFGCTVDYLVGREDDFGNVTITGTAPALSNEEERLLKAFRKLDASERDKIISDAEFFANRYTVPSFGKNRA